jgi:hypothetical protein
MSSDSFPIQANNTVEGHSVSFQFKDTGIKIGRELNERRNAHFPAAIAKRINNVLSDYLLHLYIENFKKSVILLNSSLTPHIKYFNGPYYIR